jgi:hypothetical protein
MIIIINTKVKLLLSEKIENYCEMGVHFYRDLCKHPSD